MKKSRFTDSQIMSILKQAEAGTPVSDGRSVRLLNASMTLIVKHWRLKWIFPCQQIV